MLITSWLEVGCKEVITANALGVLLDHEIDFIFKINCIVKDLKSHQIDPMVFNHLITKSWSPQVEYGINSPKTSLSP